MLTTYDLGPAAAQVARLADGVRDDQLGAATPCTDWSVTDLLNHLLMLTAAFAAAARKTPFAADAPEFSGQLSGGWQAELSERLDTLVAAWREPAAWQGEAEAGDVRMPAEAMGVVALDELLLHGWDLAMATGQPFDADPTSVQACLGFAASMSAAGQEASREGLYGPVVPVPAEAADLDRLLGFAGRDPRWAQGTSAKQA